MYEYMTEYERATASFGAQLDNAFMKIDFAFESLQREHEIRMHAIEAESYMIESFDALSEKYQAETELYTEGLKKAWTGFKQFIGKVLDKIKEMLGVASKKSDDMDANGTVTVPIDLKEATKDQNRILTALRNLPSFYNSDGTLNKKKLAAALGIGAGAAVGIRAFFKSRKKDNEGKPTVLNVRELKEAIGTNLKALGEAKEVVDSLDKVAADGKDSAEVKDMVQAATDAIALQASALQHALPAPKEEPKKDEKPAEPKAKGDDTGANKKPDPQYYTGDDSAFESVSAFDNLMSLINSL